MKNKFNFRFFFRRKTNLEKALKTMQKLTIEDLRNFRLAVNKRLDRLSAEMIYEKIKTNETPKLNIGRTLDVINKVQETN